MSIASPINFSVDDTLKLLTERTLADPDAAQRFFLKVYRRNAQFGRTSEHAATFGAAGLIHFAQPESWLPGLFGGGDYEIYAYDPTDPGKKIGGMIVLSYPGDRKVKPAYKQAMESQSWRGPGQLVFPDEASVTPVTGAAAVAVPPGVPPPQVGGAPLPHADSKAQETSAALWASMQRTQQLELQLEREKVAREAEAARARDKAEADRRQSELEQKLAQVQAQSQAKPGPSTVETIVAVATAVAPLVKMFMESSAAARTEQQQAMSAILSKVSEPKGMSPEVTMLIEMMKSQSMAAGDMMSRMTEVMSTVNSMSMSMITTMADTLEIGRAHV